MMMTNWAIISCRCPKSFRYIYFLLDYYHYYYYMMIINIIIRAAAFARIAKLREYIFSITKILTKKNKTNPLRISGEWKPNRSSVDGWGRRWAHETGAPTKETPGDVWRRGDSTASRRRRSGRSEYEVYSHLKSRIWVSLIHLFFFFIIIIIIILILIWWVNQRSNIEKIKQKNASFVGQQRRWKIQKKKNKRKSGTA